MGGFTNIMPSRGWYEEAQTIAHGAILDAYAELGTCTHPPRKRIINNFTDIDIWISFDGIVNHIAIPKGGHFVDDDATNGTVLPAHTTFYVKRFTAGVAPTSGSVVLSLGYMGV